MELKTASIPEIKTVYETLLRPSFPASELRPLSSILTSVEDGSYEPLVLWDGGKILGACFLSLGVPGWMVLDYLCVDPACRSGGYGADILRLVQEAYPNWVIMGESEDPDFAPDPALAKRRLGFYARSGVKTAGYDAEEFGVRYKVLYLSKEPVADADLMVQHRFIYESRLGTERFKKYFRIPFPAGAKPMAKVPWVE